MRVLVSIPEPGQAFPPRDVEDIVAYDDGECFSGFLDWKQSDPAPGGNHPPAYRWGWQCAERDHSREDDGYDGLRRAYIHARRTRAAGIEVREVAAPELNVPREMRRANRG